MFPREGGDPGWATAFEDEQNSGIGKCTTPAEAGAQLERWK